jgi:hypothetical protein
VFAALDRVEVLFALAIAGCLVVGPRTTAAVVLGAAVVVVLLVQLVAGLLAFGVVSL